MKRIPQILIILFISIFNFAVGQTNYQPPRQFTVFDGLPSNYIFNIEQDKHGFIWIGTNNGIIRYDGKQLKKINFGKYEGQEIPAPCKIIGILEDKLFIGGYGGLKTVDINTQEVNYYPQGFDGEKSISILETFVLFKDSKKRLWLTTSNAGIFLWNNKNKRFEKFKVPSYLPIKEFNWVSSLFERKNGDIVFSTHNGIALYKNNDSITFLPHKEFARGLSACRTNLTKITNSDKVLASRDDFGLSLFDLNTGEHQSLKIETKKLDILELGEYYKKELLLQSNFGLITFDSSTKRYNNFRFNNEALRDIKVDKDGNIWICNPNGLEFYKKDLPIEGKFTHPLFNGCNIHYDTLEKIFYAVNIYLPNQLYSFSFKDTNIKKIGTEFDNKLMHVTKTLTKINDTFYISTYNGLWKYNIKMKAPIAISEPTDLIKLYHTNNQLRYFKNDILITGVPSGPLIYNTQTLQYKSLNQQSLFRSASISKAASCIAATYDLTGNIYAVQAYSDTITKFTNDGKLLEYILLPDILKNKPFYGFNSSIIVDKLNNIWVLCQDQSLFKLESKTKQWVNFYASKLLPNGNFEKMEYDGDETFYLFHPDRSYSINISTNKTKRIDLSYANKTTLSTVADIFPIDKNKLMVLDGSSNATIYNTKQQNNQKASFLFIENLKLNGLVQKEHLITNEIVIPPNNNDFSLDIGVVYIDEQEPIRYFAQLEGVDAQWINLENNRTLHYSAIKPGEYTLRLKAASVSGLFPDVEKSIRVIVKAAWHQTWWFKILSALAIGLSIFYIIRLYYLNQLQKQKAESDKQIALATERNRIAADMHDDLGSGLSQIRFMARDAIEKTDDLELKKLLESTKNKSDGLVDKMNDIIWSLNDRDASLEELIINMKANFSELANSSNTKFTISIPEHIPIIQLTNNVKRNLYLVSKEAVHNAIKHSNAETISMNITFNNNQIKIDIQDDGIGFDASKKTIKGNGLSNYFKRMESIGGTVNIDTNASGTRISFKKEL